MNNFINLENEMYMNYNGLHPIDILGQSNVNNYYQKRYLYNKIYSCFDFDLPKEWDLNTFRLLLFHYGSVCIFYSKKFGWVYAPWTPKTFNIYFNPLKVQGMKINSIEEFKNLEGTNGVDCQIIKIFDDYLGFEDLVRDYSNSLALCDKAIKVALMNANVNLIAFAENQKDATEIKASYAKATEGEPLVILMNKKDPEEIKDLLVPFTNHDTIAQLDKLLVGRRTIVNNFLTEIGIKNSNTQKKERLVNSEIESNSEETSANVTIAYNNIMEGFEKFKEISGITISCDLHYDYENKDTMIVTEGGEENV